jgi:hypothetical protein
MPESDWPNFSRPQIKDDISRKKEKQQHEQHARIDKGIKSKSNKIPNFVEMQSEETNYGI